ncbi:hypothetical protein F0562_025809 [Nyssa sinensis]|uniref:TF-B3 domain-containing protein n=1 Tax=Nyssa sinensis TaxID=561372 RepID=A0A5J5BBI7_9ASTE|nr:hypothetical protein F0562_025809 [Nyssa sinensis]
MISGYKLLYDLAELSDDSDLLCIRYFHATDFPFRSEGIHWNFIKHAVICMKARMTDHGVPQLKLEVCFKKILTKADINYCLEVPQAALNLPKVDEVMYVMDQKGGVWMFRASIRRTGRRYFSNDWLAFVRAASARPGDKLTYYRLMVNENRYVVRLQRPVDFRLFGRIIHEYRD